MSRYSLKPLSHRADVFEVAVGWDPGLCTYFAIVFGAPTEDFEPEVLVTRGTSIGELSDLRALHCFVREFAELPIEFIDGLENDRLAYPQSLASPTIGAIAAFLRPERRGW
mgnify:CR=1 FL=1